MVCFLKGNTVFLLLEALKYLYANFDSSFRNIIKYILSFCLCNLRWISLLKSCVKIGAGLKVKRALLHLKIRPFCNAIEAFFKSKRAWTEGQVVKITDKVCFLQWEDTCVFNRTESVSFFYIVDIHQIWKANFTGQYIMLCFALLVCGHTKEREVLCGIFPLFVFMCGRCGALRCYYNLYPAIGVFDFCLVVISTFKERLNFLKSFLLDVNSTSKCIFT